MGHVSVPYEKGSLLYLKHVKMGARPGTMYREVDAVFGCVDASPGRAEAEVEELLHRITSDNLKGQRPALVRPIGRVEIFCDDHTTGAQGRLQDRGLVLFDMREKPVVHVLHALIGYEGSGSSLTQAILRDVGVPERIFLEIQDEFRGVRTSNIPYYIVIQSAPRGDGELDWGWHSVVRLSPA